MSWAEELYKVYEQQCGIDHHDGKILLPISHETVKAQIEVTLKCDGSFVIATELNEEGNNTIIPVTEGSGSRSGTSACAMPFADKLSYIAGDYFQYTDKDNSKRFDAYISQLEDWHNSQYTHSSVDAVFAYLSQKTLIGDLIDCHVLEADPETNKIKNKKLIDVFVRFRIQSDNPETWKDTTLYDSFIAWNNSKMDGENQLCYALGKELIVTYKHPKKIIPSYINAKLISANDENGFTYRGRFADKTEAISVSYDFSQKMHNALKWLVRRQGIHFDKMCLVVWASSFRQIPDINEALFDEDDDEYFDEPEQPDTEPIYRQRLKEYIFKWQEEDEKLKFDPSSKVMVMGLETTTDSTGRLSITYYEELEYSRLLEQLVKWHSETAALRRFSKQKTNKFCSFSVRDIIDCAYGLENGKGFLECKPEITKDNVLRFIPCITQGRALPVDIVTNLVRKASNPLSYDKDKTKHTRNHRKVVETACGMIRKFNLDRKKGVTSMAYDPNENDRDYLYGCLLAVADAAESAAYDEDDRGKRVTNARRLWNTFSQRPWTTWKVIEGKLRPYLDKTNQYGRRTGIRYEKMLNEIMDKFSKSNFEKNDTLSPNYLLGYHHYTAVIYAAKPEKKTEEE